MKRRCQSGAAFSFVYPAQVCPAHFQVKLKDFFLFLHNLFRPVSVAASHDLQRLSVHFLDQSQAFFQVLHGLFGILVLFFYLCLQGIRNLASLKSNPVQIPQQIHQPGCPVCLFLGHASGRKQIRQILCNMFVQPAHLGRLLRNLRQQLCIIRPDCSGQQTQHIVCNFPAADDFTAHQL